MSRSVCADEQLPAGVARPRMAGRDLARLAQPAGPEVAAGERAATLARIERGQAAS